eukprot:scaffold152589_cov44-Prasinocladus_malaysianus.AAC.4
MFQVTLAAPACTGCPESFLKDIGVILAKNRDKNQEAHQKPSPRSLPRNVSAKPNNHLRDLTKSRLEKCISGE